VRPALALLAGALAAVTATAAVAQAPVPAGADEAAIRGARAASNASIARHDTAGIASHWLPDVHIVTSTAAQSTGIESNRQRMATQFERRPDTVYVRTPVTVDVLTAWNVASERGEWTGTWTEPDGRVDIGGTYLAQWRKADGTWKVQAELYVPTYCRGSASYCGRHP
jgi:ketosteroid isomerase-like protein